MSRFLIMTWDGAGNLAPTLGIARTLVERGHDVRLMGTAPSPSDAATWDPLRPVEPGRALGRDGRPGRLRGRDPAPHQRAELQLDRRRRPREGVGPRPADAVLVDCMLFTAIDVAVASGSPTATLFHTAYTVFRGGPLVEMFAPGMEIANARRAELGLPAIERLGDIHDACACAIVALPKEFEPDVPDAGNVLRIGPVLDAPPLCWESTRSTSSRADTAGPRQFEHQRAGPGRPAAAVRRRGCAVAGERNRDDRTVDRSRCP